jgi:two-component system, NtrC family, response regulator AtoC
MLVIHRTQTDGSDDLPPTDVIFGKSLLMATVRTIVEKVACTTLPILLQGESGTGKDIIARLLHMRSKRANRPLVKVSCPAIPDSLIESELFGYERGAFTGAFVSKPGQVERAHMGTLFLDEVGCLCPTVQTKLLQLLQDGTFTRLGAQEALRINTRLICATNENLLQQTENGRFRRDIFFRINAITLELPPLRQRIVDLATLVDYFLELYSRAFNVDPKPMPGEIMRRMQQYHWPGNIRELQNLIRGYVLVNQEEWVYLQMARSKPAGDGSELDLSQPVSLKAITKDAMHRLEHQIIWKVLEMHGWNRMKTAHWLKISYRSLMYKLKDVKPCVSQYGSGESVDAP